MKKFRELLLMLVLSAQSYGAEKISASDLIFEDMKKSSIQAATIPLRPETSAEFKQRMAWFTDARYGMFIHFGPYAIYGGVYKGKPARRYAEWILCNAKIPKAEYEKTALTFNPVNWDAESIVKTAKAAGMKYIVITTKHHDGFCLWDAPDTDYDISATPFKRDLLQELAEACKKHGLRFGTYYSTLDWYHPTQDNGQIVSRNPKVSPENQEKYIRYMKSHLKDLITKYDTDIIWFDGDWMKWWTMDQGIELYNYLRELKPSILINNRVAKRATFKFDYGTPEQVKLGKPVDYLWESCYTINHSWGYKISDTSWKSSKQILEDLIDINSKGGNYLLNIGPMADGTVPPASVKVLLDAGQWVQNHADAIYGTEACRLPKQSWGRITVKGPTHYLHIFKMPPTKQIVVEGLFTGETNTKGGLVSANEKGLAVDLSHFSSAELIPVLPLMTK